MSAPVTIATVLDVLSLVDFLVNEQGEWAKDEQEIRHYIWRADGKIRSKLRNAGYGSDLTVTPYSGYPWWNEESNDDDSGSLRGDGISASSSAVSEMWTLTFTSATEFGISGTYSGASQGSGSTGSESSSTNGNLTIATSAWSGTFATGDLFYVSTYDHEALLVDLSALLASARILDSVYGENVPNRSEMAVQYKAEAREILDDLTDPNGTMELECGRAEVDLAPIELEGLEQTSDVGEDGRNLANEEGFDK